MYDLTKAEKIYNDSHMHIGYILKLAEDAWVPLDIEGKNYSGPSYKADAEAIVKLKYKESTNT